MNSFNYAAKDQAGQTVKGAVPAATRYEALAAVRAKGLTVVSLEAGAAEVQTAGMRTGRRKRRSGLMFPAVSLPERSAFCRQLAISVGAGIPLRESLESIADDMDNAAFRSILQDVLHRLDDGHSFSEALSGREKIFDKLFVALIRTAEESGSMAQTLETLASSLEKTDRMNRKIRSITAYPAFVAVFFCVITLVMTVFVLPRFQDIFSSMEADLPALTRHVLAANRFLLHNALAIAAGILAVSVAMVLYGRTPAGRLAFDRLWLRLPIAGPTLRKIAVARFCRSLSVMIRGGVPVAGAMSITADVLGNKALEVSLQKSRDLIIAGSDISASLDREVFPRLMIRMVGVGESSGRLPEVLEKVSDVYENEVEGSAALAAALFEPFIICFFGAIVLVLVIAIYLPVFTVASHVK